MSDQYTTITITADFEVDRRRFVVNTDGYCTIIMISSGGVEEERMLLMHEELGPLISGLLMAHACYENDPHYGVQTRLVSRIAEDDCA